MGPKKCNENNKCKKKAVRATIEVKKDLIAKHESGTRVTDLVVMFGIPKSTISTILKNKEAIKAADVAKGVTTLSSRRTKSMEEMEKLLLVWINKKQLAGDVITETIICEKAKVLYNDLENSMPGTSDQKVDFKASRGWFENFKKRTGIHSVMHGEAARKNLWPECVAARGIEGVEEPSVVPDIVSLGQSMGLEISKEGVNKLVDNHRTELTMEELQYLSQQQQKEISEDISGEEERDPRTIPSGEIKDLLSMWSETQATIEKWHPNKALVDVCVKLFDDNIIEHFRKLQKGHQHQTTLECLFSKAKASDPKPSTSGTIAKDIKRQRIQIPEVIVEDDSSSSSIS